MSDHVNAEQLWSKPPVIENRWLRWGITLVVLVYAFFAIRSFEIDIPRIIIGLDRGYDMLLAFLRPDFVARQTHIVRGVLESVAMTATATLLGGILSIPLSFGAARNLSPLPVYLVCRSILMIVRSLHVVVLAILFVVMVGFGPFAGAVTLGFNSIGFLGKLLAEDIENTNEESMEAVRATGGSWLQVVIYAVWPQVVTRFIGLSIYRLDINFRQSTVIGLVGAGGIGAVLDTAMGRYDYNTAAAILIVIIAIVLAGEYVSSSIRRRLT